MFDTKIAVVLRADLQVWQTLNVTAFLISGIVGQTPEIIGEPYVDSAGNVFNAMSVQPMIVLCADSATLSEIHQRAVRLGVRTSAYIEEMFATGFDAANRHAFSRFAPADAKIVGVALRAAPKAVDKITKGAVLHA